MVNLIQGYKIVKIIIFKIIYSIYSLVIHKLIKKSLMIIFVKQKNIARKYVMFVKKNNLQ